MSAATPYYYFVSDDHWIFHWEHSQHYPFFIFRLLVVPFVALGPSVGIPLFVATCLSVAAVQIGAWIRSIGEPKIKWVFAMGLWWVFPWTQTYFVFGHHAPLAAAYTLFLFLRVKLLGQIWASILIGSFFYSTPSAPIYIASWFLVRLMVIRKCEWRLWVLSSALILIPMVMFDSIRVDYVSAIVANRQSAHRQEAFGFFGSDAWTPVFSFFRMLWVYNPLFLILSILFRSTIGWLGIALGLSVDLLPQTKLARHLFPAFCLLYVGIAVALVRHGFSIRLNRFLKNRWSAALSSWGARLLIAFSVWVSAIQTLTLYQARRQPIQWIRSQPDQEWRVLLSDPIRIWYEPTLGIQTEEVQSVRQVKKGEKLIVGPSDGRNLLRHSCLENWYPEDPLKFGFREIKRFRHWGFFPLFRFEEEVSQALTLRGKVENDHPKQWVRIFERVD